MALGESLEAHCLEVEAEALTPLVLEEYSGAAVRGALFEALWGRFCTNKAAPACAVCPLIAGCPVATLVAPLREENARGQDVPRPYVVTPPAGGAYQPGQRLTFGLTLFGQATRLLPYVVLALDLLAETGLGRRLGDQGGRRGRLVVRTVAAVHPLTGEHQALYRAGRPRVEAPGLPVTAADVARRAARLPADRLALTLLTPTRLTDGGGLVRRLAPLPLALRLLERLDALRREYGDGLASSPAERAALAAAAAATTVLTDETHWLDLWSHSSRQRRLTPIGGLVGAVAFGGEVAALREVLVWGEIIRVGKNAVKGSGRYRLDASEAGDERDGAGRGDREGVPDQRHDG